MEIVLCVTGSIAAIESIKLARELVRHGISVKCFMSDSACEIIHPYTMEFATEQKVVTKLTGNIEHVKYANSDLILVAPATANAISKFAYKIADNPINTLLITAFGYKTPILIVPSMHNSMYKAIKGNIETLKGEGITFVKPKIEEKKAKFPNINDIVLRVLRETSKIKDFCGSEMLSKSSISEHESQIRKQSISSTSKEELTGKKVLVSAGATYEKIDEIRGITNRSSGKMGVEIAKEAFIRGAEVTLIKGNMSTNVPNVFNIVEVESTDDMQSAVIKLAAEHDIFISAAAISDFKVKKSSEMTKISSDKNLILELKRTPKIINTVKEMNPKIFLVGFKAVYDLSDDELIEAAKQRMKESHADLMIANDVAREGAGFGSDENQVILIDTKIIKIPLSPKKEIAAKIINRIIEKI